MSVHDSKKFTLADVMNLKPGDVFYYNYSHLRQSQKHFFSHLEKEKYGLRIYYVSESSIDDKYFMSGSYLSDCGVVPYSHTNYYTDSNGFSKTNFLTKNKVDFNN